MGTADERLIALQHKHYYNNLINDCYKEFTWEKVVKLASGGVYTGLLMAESILIYKLSTEDSESTQEGENVQLLLCSLTGLGLRAANSTLNYSEYYTKSQEAAVSKMEVTGRALKLMENLELNQQEIQNLAVRAGRSLVEVMKTLEEEKAQRQKLVVEKDKEIRGWITAWLEDKKQGSQLKGVLIELWKMEPWIFQGVFEALKGGQDVEAVLGDQTKRLRDYLEQNNVNTEDILAEDDQILAYWQNWKDSLAPMMLNANPIE